MWMFKHIHRNPEQLRGHDGVACDRNGVLPSSGNWEVGKSIFVHRLNIEK